MNLTVHTVGDTATPALRQAMQSLAPEQLAAKIGPACQALTERHLAALPANKKGWPTTGFYKKFVSNVSWQRSGNGVAISIAPAQVNGRSVTLAQRIYGGPISPVKARMLAYPISPASYGKLPSDFPNLFVFRCSKGVYLVQAEKTNKTGRRGNLNFLFKLSTGVFQRPDKNVLPTTAEYAEAASAAVWQKN